MYTFELSDKYLSTEEQDIFSAYLVSQGLDKSIWDVFSCLFKSGTKNTTPLLLKAYNESNLCGVAIVIKCRKYGKSLFKNQLFSRVMDFINIPFYLWIKFGSCMDMMSNPGFAKKPEKSDEVFRAMINYLKRKSILTIVTDYTDNRYLYNSASVLPALPQALIDCSEMKNIEDYKKNFKNINRKLKTFKKKGGEYLRIEKQLDDEQISNLKRCFLSTADKSVFYLPYQELYLNSALHTSRTNIKNVHYFVAFLDGKFIGYQAAIKTGNHLNALHGAFDRNLKTTYHAYDILFVKMTEFALENNLLIVDFGAVVNHTKQKMMNKSNDISYFILSKHYIIQKVFSAFLKLTNIQSKKQMKFRNIPST